jgi:hypothetical protein
MDVQQGVDLRQARPGAQMAQVHRVDPHRAGRGTDHAFERALLDAVLDERTVFGQRMVARADDGRA